MPELLQVAGNVLPGEASCHWAHNFQNLRRHGTVSAQGFYSPDEAMVQVVGPFHLQTLTKVWSEEFASGPSLLCSSPGSQAPTLC